MNNEDKSPWNQSEQATRPDSPLRTVTAKDYLADPQGTLRIAREAGSVVVLGRDGRPHLSLSFSKDPEPASS